MQVAFAYNTSIHSSTRFAPYFLTHGREAWILVNVVLGQVVQGRPTDGSLEDFASPLLRCLDTAFSQTKDNNIVANRRQKSFYDAKLKHEPYEVGDLVWLNDPTESHCKLAPHRKGP